MEFSSPGSSKRAKTPGGNVGMSVSCSVDGCSADLGLCREYHRRHKVCELHSKTAKVTIGGREQRFCQQCSRFHSLVEFDEGKRSCRKRLDGHNRRRRKPQVDPNHRASGLFFSSPQQGTTMLSFNNPQIQPSSVVRSAWSGVVNQEHETMMFNNHTAFNYADRSDHNSYKETNQISFFQGTDRNNQGGNSDLALSLLSSAMPTQTRDVGPSQMVRPSIIRSQSMMHNLQFSGLGQYPTFGQEMDNEAVLSDANGADSTTTLHFHGMFHDGRDSSSGNGNQQTLSFRWD